MRARDPNNLRIHVLDGERTACRSHTGTRRTNRRDRYQAVCSIRTNQTPFTAQGSPSSAVGAPEDNYG
jgi:hypothetical protein